MKLRATPVGAVGLVAAFAVNAWLFSVIVTELGSDAQAIPEKADWHVNLAAADSTIANRKPIDAYPQILEHPVFFKSRAPFVPPPPPPPRPPAIVPPTAAVDPGLALGGIMMNKNVRKAYVFSKAGASGAWTSEGDEFMGWRVSAINGSGAKLEQSGRSIELLLYPRE